MAFWQQVHLITLRTSHLHSRKELGWSVWGDLWPQGRRGCLNSGTTRLPPSTPVPRGTCQSRWPPRGCGDKVRKGQVTKTGVTMERESQLRCGPPSIPFSLLWGVAAEICRDEQEEGGRASQPAPLSAPGPQIHTESVQRAHTGLTICYGIFITYGQSCLCKSFTFPALHPRTA